MLLDVKNGSFSYGEYSVLKQINMSVDHHDIFAILGRNGVGKTTLLRCIMNMLPWESGCTLLNGRDIRRIPRKTLWKEIAYVPQAKSTSDLSVRDMIVIGRSSYISTFGKPIDEDYDIADEIINQLRITSICKKPCNQLSGGELQMVLIGRALAARPRLLIMDEPESNLDYRNQMHILNLIRTISSETACVLNTHYPEHALRYANKALLINPDGSCITGIVDDVITESNIKIAFGIDVCIGTHLIEDRAYKYVIPFH